MASSADQNEIGGDAQDALSASSIQASGTSSSITSTPTSVSTSSSLPTATSSSASASLASSTVLSSSSPSTPTPAAGGIPGAVKIGVGVSVPLLVIIFALLGFIAYQRHKAKRAALRSSVKQESIGFYVPDEPEMSTDGALAEVHGLSSPTYEWIEHPSPLRSSPVALSFVYPAPRLASMGYSRGAEVSELAGS